MTDKILKNSDSNKEICISLIAAISENGFIGKDGDLPWRISTDWKYFKNMTINKPVIMGRKTFESLGHPLPKRPNIVITRQQNFKTDKAYITNSLSQAIKIAKEIAIVEKIEEAFIIGGSEIYAQSLNIIDRMYLTEVHMQADGDTKFPEINWKKWIETSRTFNKAKDGEDANFSFVIYNRRK